VCKCVLLPGDNPIVVNKYIISFTKHKGREMLKKQEREGRANNTTATRSETDYINSERKSKVGDPLPQYQIHRRMEIEQVSIF